ncbi:thymidylate kinase [Candidatus Scalindua japonica]|uniref:Thymidylate kinase n=1 Tax=Candidatus Scalindua japonica TaxID=1284222 RepID=A0A286TVU3_9BACT|nr:thymidylate kinase [Candidatus Scalindua japonica]
MPGHETDGIEYFVKADVYQDSIEKIAYFIWFKMCVEVEIFSDTLTFTLMIRYNKISTGMFV